MGPWPPTEMVPFPLLTLAPLHLPTHPKFQPMVFFLPSFISVFVFIPQLNTQILSTISLLDKLVLPSDSDKDDMVVPSSYYGSNLLLRSLCSTNSYARLLTSTSFIRVLWTSPHPTSTPRAARLTAMCSGMILILKSGDCLLHIRLFRSTW